MLMKTMLIVIATHLTNQRESKKHGDYEIYEDEKIKIAYDTYYPNVQVNVKISGKSHLAAIFSGHGHTQEFHGGAWEKYVSDVLYTAAVIKQQLHLEQKEQRKLDNDKAKNARLNDESVFS
jgi:hypothetical protein